MESKLEILKRNTHRFDKLLAWAVRAYIVMASLINVFILLGCIQFYFGHMQYVYYLCNMFFVSWFIYENFWISEKEKILLLGIATSCVALASEKYALFYMLILVIILLLGDVKLDIKQILINAAISYEVYSVLMLVNKALYKEKIESSFLFKYIDVIFLLLMIFKIIFDTKKVKEFVSSFNIVKKKMDRRVLWGCGAIVMLALLIIISNKSDDDDERFFFFGKTAEKGYVSFELDGECTGEYFVQTKDAGYGMEELLSCPQKYNFIETGEQISYQLFALYFGKTSCYILYGAKSMIFILLVAFAIMSINGIEKK